jgi:hypothetical protein
LPALRKIASQPSSKICMKNLVFLTVLFEKFIPLLLSSGSFGGMLMINVIDLLGNNE